MKCLIVFLLVTNSCIKCMESIHMEHSKIDDQTSSASGYAYQLHSGGPLTYAAYPGLSQLAYTPLPLGRYTQQLPLQLPQYKPQTAPLLPPYGLHAYPAAAGYALQPLAIEPAKLSPPPVIATNQAANFVKGGGSNYANSNENSHGEKGSTGYKNSESYEKGAQGKHDNQDHKEHYNEEGGSKANHHDAGAHYSNEEKAAKGAEGASFHNSNSHKKGSKTNGFHRVHHKDEYKKDHEFYDEADSSGHFHKHGNYNAKNAAENGGFEKGGHEKGAYQLKDQGVKGFLDKGNFLDQNSGFRGEQGKEAHFKDFQQYAKDAAQQEQKEDGYDKKEVFNAQQ